MFLKFWPQGKLEEGWGGKAGGEKYSKMLKNAKNGLDAYYLLSRYVNFRGMCKILCIHIHSFES